MTIVTVVVLVRIQYVELRNSATEMKGSPTKNIKDR